MYHQVTLRTNPIDPDYGPPAVGSRVFIGTGAKLIGKIVIGDDTRIGANAVVLCDVPPKSTAVGVPASIFRC